MPYEPWGDSMERPHVADTYVQMSPVIVLGTIESDDGVGYNTPDGSPCGSGHYHLATVGDLDPIRGTVNSRTISIVIEGDGELGCDLVDVKTLPTPVGGRYVLLLSAYPGGGAGWVDAAWPITGDTVRTGSGEMTLAQLRSLVAAVPCEAYTRCNETSLP